MFRNFSRATGGGEECSRNVLVMNCGSSSLKFKVSMEDKIFVNISVCWFAVDIEPGQWRVFSQWSGGQDTGQHDTTDQIQPCW